MNGNFFEAAQIYEKIGKLDKAIEIFTDLKQWDKAINYIKKNENNNVNTNEIQNRIKTGLMNKLLVKQAEWYNEIGQYKEAGKIYLNIKDYSKSIEIYGKNNCLEELIDICRNLNVEEFKNEIRNCAN